MPTYVLCEKPITKMKKIGEMFITLEVKNLHISYDKSLSIPVEESNMCRSCFANTYVLKLTYCRSYIPDISSSLKNL